MVKKLIIAGGSGSIGQRLIEHLRAEFQEIVVLTRGSAKDYGQYRTVTWDAQNLGSWCDELKDADVLINLTGKSIQCRFTAENKIALVTSRVDSTMVLAKALMEKEHKIHTWLNASGAAIYPQSRDTPMDEHVLEKGKGFLAELSEIWEKAFYHQPLKLRRIALRITPVLDAKEGFFPPLKKLSSIGLGGAQGSGKQMVSWIHHRDFCNAISFLLAHDEISGPVNMSAEGALDNASFMKTTRKSLGMPLGLPAPALAIRLGTWISGVDSSLVLDSSYVTPSKLLQHGFSFEFPRLEEALADILKEE